MRVLADLGGESYCSCAKFRAAPATEAKTPWRRTLGWRQSAAVVRIEWPSGIVQEFRDVAANQALVVNEPPVLSAPARRADGLFEFPLISRNGPNYRIEASQNLTTWQEFSTVLDVHGAVQVVGGAAGSFQRRYYRAVEMPSN